jgi:lipoate-protein ligase A
MIIPYPLPDKVVIEAGFNDVLNNNFSPEGEFRFSIFVPDACYVSLGASNNIDSSVYEDICIADNVQIFQRLSGGEAVFLSPNCVVCSALLLANALPRSADYFSSNLQWIVSALEALGIKDIKRKGISDLTIADKKILGCAIYKRTNVILFQAVLNVCEDPAVIHKYLRHPNREPDYRGSRKHEDFITSLRLQGYDFNPQDIAEQLTKHQY